MGIKDWFMKDVDKKKKKVKVKIKNKPKGKKLFKKIILSFWVWLLLALVFYFIFYSIPIQTNESGYGWNILEGINLYKTIFGYMYVFAFLIAIILIIISIIKRIHKSSIGDYWKISWTIIGIVLIIILSVFYLRQYMPTNDFSIPEFDEDKFVKEYLEEKGYEVISNSYFEAMGWASVKMKSLGNKNDQAWDGLIALQTYKNATDYIITILTPESECRYRIDGDIYRMYRDLSKSKETIIIEGVEYTGRDYYLYIDDQIKEASERCS